MDGKECPDRFETSIRAGRTGGSIVTLSGFEKASMDSRIFGGRTLWNVAAKDGGITHSRVACIVTPMPDLSQSK